MAYVADLQTFRRHVNASSNVDDVNLREHLEAATCHVAELVSATYWEPTGNIDGNPEPYGGVQDPRVVEAILLIAAKLHKREQTPEGVAGFGAEGATVRIFAADPDARRLLERCLDYGSVGIG